MSGEKEATGALPAAAVPGAEETGQTLLREPLPLLRLLPALVLAAAIVLSVLSRSWDRVILPLEVFADLFIVFFAFRHKSAGMRWWRAAALALLAGDSFYMVGHSVSSYPAWAFKVQESFYTLSRWMTAAYLLSNLRTLGGLRAAEKVLLAALFVLITFISVKYLLIPFYNNADYATLFFRANAVLNRLAESAVFPLAVLLGMKARSRHWLYFTHGIMLISISSIAIGHYISLSATMTGIPLQEYGWLCGLLLVLAAQAYRPGGAGRFAGWDSARVRTIWLVLVFNLALLAALYFINISVGKDAFQLTSLLFVLYGIWLAANVIAFRMSEDLQLLLESVSGGAPVPGRGFRMAIYEADLFADKLQAAYGTIRSQARLAAMSSLAAQVAHDIRSPLAALEAALADVSQLPEEKRGLIRGAAARIRGIADGLLDRYRGGAPARSAAPRPLAALVAQVLDEKRLLLGGRPGVKIEFQPPEGAGSFVARVDPVEFGRVFSNLLNNAAEAIEGAGTITISLENRGGGAALTVKDDGRGIPPELLGRLGAQGETHGKSGGSGLGLHHARTAAESWGGSLEISSAPGGGTEVRLLLPPAGAAPAPAGGTAALLDDDGLVLLTWRAAARAAGVDLRAHSDPAAFLSEVKALPADTPLYLDSELGGGAAGEKIAGELRALGFTDITLSTGHPPEKFAGRPWLKIAGKEPPWAPGPRG